MKPRFKRRVEGNTIMNDISFALTSKPVIVILSISAAIRGLFQFALLPNSPSVLGPDEGTYALLAKYVSEGLPVEEFPFYHPSIYSSTKSTTLPSAFLIKLGLEELTAVRTIASVYGLASTLLLVLSFIAYLRLRNQNTQDLSSSLDKKFIFVLAFFAFLPSNFVWSTVGLRESGSQFWLIATFYLVLKLLSSTHRDAWKFTALSAFALTFAYGARPQTALVFSIVALFFSTAILLKFRKFMPLIAILIGIFAGQAFTTTPATPATPATSATSATSATPATINPLKTLQNQVLTIRILEYKRSLNSLGAQSALPISICQSSSNEIVKIIKCNLSELPYRLFAFLFRPLIFFDQGSTTLNFAALENLGWMILVPLSIWISLRKRENTLDRFINLSLTSYVIVFASAAALYEGNLGTAFRHKSTILWPLVFILMVAPQISPKFKTSKRFTKL
jgi:hypothetical protein